jgi:Ca-activated chloride channel family protein
MMMTCTPMSDAELARLGTRDDAGFGAVETARGPLPMTAMTVDARVVGLLAEIDLAQTFENTLAEPIEATYVFPLPDRAAATRFRMEVAGRVIDGVIEERGRAREQYDQAIAAGHRAAITEEERAGVFTLRVGNLMPGEVAVVRLTMVGPLSLDDGEVTFRFPLVVAPRYIPGHALPGPRAGLGVAADTDAVPDASRITPPVLLPGCPNPVRLAITLAVDGGGLPVGELRSSLHAVVAGERAGVRRVELRPGERLDRDFIVRWSVGDAEVRSSAVAVTDADGEGATLLCTLVPPREEGAGGGDRPRDVVFVLDRSGSMGGWKMVAARRAVARMVDTLGARDRFSVMAFDDRIDEPPGLPARQLVAATDRHRFRAVEFLAALDARGGTELRAPLSRGVDLLAGGYDDRDRVLILVTDGQVGNEDQILRELAARVKNVRVFTLGVDQAVNAAFLRRLAAAGGGACELVESEDRLDDVMAKVHRRIGTPVVTELALAGDGVTIAPGSQAPHRLPALFAGAPVVVAARLAGGATAGRIVVTGKTPSGQPWRQVVDVRADGRGDAAAAVWARARIRDLEDQYATRSSGKDALEREIVATSLRHRVLSRFTAFLAVDRAEKVNVGGRLREVVQAVEAPAGWAMPTSTMAGMAPPAPGGMPPGMPVLASAAPPAMPSIAMPSPSAPRAAPADASRKSGGGGLVERAKKLLRRQEKEEQAAPPPPPPPSSMPAQRTVMKAALADEDAEPGAAPPAAPAAHAPYLARVRMIAEAIDTALGRGDRRALDLAVARLAELVEDVTSVGGLDALARALDGVLADLRAVIGDAARSLDDARPALTALRELAAGGGVADPFAPPPRGGGRAFWK